MRGLNALAATISTPLAAPVIAAGCSGTLVARADSAHAAALSAMITSTGAFKTVQTHELLTHVQVGRTLQLASTAGQAFQRPGQP